MKIKKYNNNLIRIVIGTIVTVGACTLVFMGLTESVKAALINRTELIPATYSPLVKKAKGPEVPLGYVKAAYQVKISGTYGKPTVKDMSAEEAAELGAQSLWKIFGVDLGSKIIKMSYLTATSFRPRAEWMGYITVDENLSYEFAVDAVTGEYHTAGQSKYWNANISDAADEALFKNPDKYTALAKEAAEKYQLMSGKIVSNGYVSQGCSGNDAGKNPYITVGLKSDSGQEMRLTFSRYNQELLSVEFDSLLRADKLFEEQSKEVLKEMMNSDTEKCSIKKAKDIDVPSGYVKAPYKVKLIKTVDKPDAKDISAEEAAELGAQSLWKIFGANLSNMTVEMTYNAASSSQPGAKWMGCVTVNKKLSYMFTVDAVTGEHYSSSRSRYWSGNISIGMDKALMKSHDKYTALAKEVAEKYQLVSGKVVSAEYSSQGYTSNPYGKNPDITILVKSDSGQEAQLTFSRYNQELLSVEFNSFMEDIKILEKRDKKVLENMRKDMQ